MRPRPARNLFVITGGPGAGKTTLLTAMKNEGLAVAPEAGRAIIRTQRAIGGHAGHDRDQALYTELMLAWEIRSFEEAQENGRICLFDRGIPDLVGYCRLTGRTVPPHIRKAVELFRYNETVFILPPWPDIYIQDAERSQSLEEAERTYEAMRKAYAESGYRLVHLPRASVKERRDLLLAAIRAQ